MRGLGTNHYRKATKMGSVHLAAFFTTTFLEHAQRNSLCVCKENLLVNGHVTRLVVQDGDVAGVTFGERV